MFSGLAVALCILAACTREPDEAPQAPDAGVAVPDQPAPPASTTPVVLEDVVETTPDYVIGISYPQVARRYPGLAAALQEYADAARAELMQAVKSRDSATEPMMYDLSLSFTEVLDTPTLVAVAADGSSYTGGAHGTPLVNRFVWLPQQQRMLTAGELIADPRGWQAIAAYVREQLHAALSTRVDADELAPADRAQLVKSAGKMIDDGTRADPAHFSLFEPVVDDAGRLTGLRFVFAPYQVGPYADGKQTVEVPADVLLPHVAPEYRGLFAGG